MDSVSIVSGNYDFNNLREPFFSYINFMPHKKETLGAAGFLGPGQSRALLLARSSPRGPGGWHFRVILDFAFNIF
jgi:hypothetical protein